jgi:hypothetical protein
MDSFFHISQGMLLIEKEDADSVKKALNHFKTANLMTSSGDIAKPSTLYYLAYGNLIIGNITTAYILTERAYNELEVTKKASIFVMDRWPCEDKILELRSLLNRKYPEFYENIDVYDDRFDENYLDFSKIHRLFRKDENIQYEKHINVDNISNETLMLIFTAMMRNEEDLIYYDKISGEPTAYIEGYFVPSSGDHALNNRMLANKIMNNSPIDLVDEERHILIPKLICADFINEFKKHTDDQVELSDFADKVTEEIIDDFGDPDITSLHELYLTQYILDLFFKSFHEKIGHKSAEMMSILNSKMEQTSNGIVKRWIRSI